MKFQVLSIGKIEEGKGRAGNQWHRRTFQVFSFDDQVAGNIPVYGTEEELSKHVQTGLYEAETSLRAGDNGRLEVRITNLVFVKPSGIPEQKQ